MKAQADLMSGEVSLPGLQMATFLLCPHVVEETGLWSFPLKRALIPWWWLHPPDF